MKAQASLIQNVEPVSNVKILLKPLILVQRTNVSELHKKEKNVKGGMSSTVNTSLTVLKDLVAGQLG